MNNSLKEFANISTTQLKAINDTNKQLVSHINQGLQMIKDFTSRSTVNSPLKPAVLQKQQQPPTVDLVSDTSDTDQESIYSESISSEIQPPLFSSSQEIPPNQVVQQKQQNNQPKAQPVQQQQQHPTTSKQVSFDIYNNNNEMDATTEDGDSEALCDFETFVCEFYEAIARMFPAGNVNDGWQALKDQFGLIVKQFESIHILYGCGQFSAVHFSVVLV